jgi:uncharacterized protein
MITKFPRLDQMRSKEHSAQQDANTAYNKIRNTQERVLTAHDGARGDENGFGAAVFVDGVAWNTLHVSMSFSI